MKNTQDSTKPFFQASFGLLLAVILFTACFIIAGMVYVMQLDSHISRNHVRLTSSAEKILLDMSRAHLWLEEILSDHSDEDKKLIDTSLLNIEKQFNALKALPPHTHFFLSHSEIKDLPDLQQKAFATFLILKDSTYQRLKHPEALGIKSQADKSYDLLFRKMNDQMTDITAALQDSLTNHLAHLERTELWLIFLSIILMIAVSSIILLFFRKQEVHFKQITKQERIQHAMEEKYRALIEQSPFAIQICEPNGLTIQVNQAWENLWETSLSDHPNYNILKDPLVLKNDVYDVISNGFKGETLITTVTNFNLSIEKEKNSPLGNKFVRINLYPIRNIDAQISQIALIFSDITDSYLHHTFQIGQGNILEQIGSPEVSLYRILEDIIHLTEKHAASMVCSISLLSDDGQHLYNAASPNLPKGFLHAINNMSADKSVGSCFTPITTGEVVVVSDISTDPLWKADKKLALKAGLKSCWSQPIKDASNNTLGTFTFYFQEIRKEDLQTLELLGHAAKLTSNAILHKRSMETIVESEAQLKEAQKLSHIGNWRFCLKTHHFKWSDEIYRIFEIDKEGEHVCYDTFLNTIHPDDREQVESSYAQSIEHQNPHTITHRLLMSDGRIKHVEKRCETVFNSQGEALETIGTIQDITTLVVAQQDKEDIQSKMEHVQRLESLGVLAGGIAHDFNNILTAILGNAGLAQSKLDASSTAQSHLEHITVASKKAAELCKQMLAYSGKGHFVIKPIILSELVEEMTQLLYVTLAKNIVLRLDLSKQIPPIDADVTQLQQVIMNLVINAAEAIEEKSGSIAIATGIMRVDKAYLSETFLDESLQEGQYVYLEVSDTGCGMDAETLEKIFEPFFTTKFTGRGLGMAAILGIVRGHKGAIKTYSEPGKGTTFKVLFPCSEQTAIHLNSKTKPFQAWQGKGCVLVVDDEETIREVAISMLKDLGLKSITASDGLECVEIFREKHNEFIFVLLDMTMPRMGGEDTFTELCRIDPNVKVILSSGYNEQDATNRFAGKGLAGFLQKPYTLQELSDKITEILDKT